MGEPNSLLAIYEMRKREYERAKYNLEQSNLIGAAASSTTTETEEPKPRSESETMNQSDQQTFISSFNTAVSAQMAKNGNNRKAAIQFVAKKHPNLYQNYLRATNPQNKTL